jgi:soluble P-type ATPase
MLRKKRKKGIRLQIPGFGDRLIHTVISDYDGTLSCGGEVAASLKDQLLKLADIADIHILTADKKARSRDCFGPLPVTVHIMKNGDQDVQKRQYVQNFDASHVAALGNGHNDRLFFEAVRTAGGLCIAVDNGEGCAMDVILHAHLFIQGATKAVNLLLHPDVFAAALRY